MLAAGPANLSTTTTTDVPVDTPALPPADVVLARSGDENFPVALRLLPRAVRRRLRAVYGFARLADEIGDSLPGDRMAALDWLDAEVARAFTGRATHPLLVAVSEVVGDVGLPEQPFHDLVEANRLDQRVTRYATFGDLLGYCRLSADPVGRLVLAVFGAATPARTELSDRVCTGLQLVEHWQDVGEDARAGRVYLPAEDRQRFGVGDADLLAPTASPPLRALLRFEVARARRWVAAGHELVASLSGWARVAVAGYVAGGFAACDRILAVDGDVLASVTRPRASAVAGHAARLLLAGTPKDAR